MVDNVGKLTYEDIYQFREHLRQKVAKNSNKPLSTNTINKIMILLKRFLMLVCEKAITPPIQQI